MTFEELSTRNEDQLFEGHKGHYLESLIKRELLPKQVDHDKEHELILKSWGFEDLNPNQLKYRNDGSSIFHDRFWHIALHHLFWKENNMHLEAVAKFERELCSLEQVPKPKKLVVNNLPPY